MTWIEIGGIPYDQLNPEDIRIGSRLRVSLTVHVAEGGHWNFDDMATRSKVAGFASDWLVEEAPPKEAP